MTNNTWGFGVYDTLTGVYRTNEHVGFKYQPYDMDLEQYVSKHSDQSQFQLILEQVCDVVLELHNIGFTHRTLEPAHIPQNPFVIGV